MVSWQKKKSQSRKKNAHFKPSTSAPEARYAARREDKDTERQGELHGFRHSQSERRAVKVE